MKKHLVTNFTEFLELVDDCDIEKEIFLPITHVPGYWQLPSIVRDQKLKVFRGNNYYKDEELVFFTYGRNVYVPNEKKDLENDAYPPLVLVFDPVSINLVPKRILPFDSGGYDYYKLPEQLSISNFEINQPTIEDIKKLVILLFKSYRNYLEYKHDFQQYVKDFKLFFLELEQLEKLYTAQTAESTKIGMQGRSFEIQYSQPIPLKPILVLYPHIYQTNEVEIENSQIELAFPGVKKILYTSLGSPKDHLKVINDHIKKFIESSNNL